MSQISAERLLVDNRALVSRRIEDVLRDGFRITLPDGREVQWHRRGVQFDDGDLTFEPLETGIFQRILGDKAPRWVHMFPCDSLGPFLNKLLDAIPRKEAEAWYVMTLASVSMNRMNQDLGKARDSSRAFKSRFDNDDVEVDEASAVRFG
jgi:hypothetical protein